MLKLLSVHLALGRVGVGVKLYHLHCVSRRGTRVGTAVTGNPLATKDS